MLLNNIQDQFKNLMLDHPDTLNAPPDSFSTLFHEGPIPLSARLKIYRNNIVGSLTDIMIAGFPLIDNLVGRSFMERMARSFILKNPPTSGCLNLYGAGFDLFIAQFEPARSLPYLPDMARLETALNDAYYAGDDAPLRPEDFEDIPPEDLQTFALGLRPSVRLIDSAYPVDQIRDFCLSPETKPLQTPDLKSGGVKLMIYRPCLEVKIIKLDDDEYEMLLALAGGQNLGDALEKTLSTHKNFNFQPFLQKHIELETLKKPDNTAPSKISS